MVSKILKSINLKSNLISFAILLSTFIQPLKVFALTEADVISKLQNIPLFGIVDQQGMLNSYLFVDPDQALSVYQDLQNTDPYRANSLEVQPISLSTVYQKLQTIQAQNTEIPELIVPDQNSLDLATSLMRSNGQSVNDPRTIGIPLFVATIGTGAQEQWLILTNRDTNKSYIPFYFDKTEADQIVATYKQNNPNDISSVQVRVFSLGYIVGLLLANNNEATQMMEIIPSMEQIDTANRLLRQQ